MARNNRALAILCLMGAGVALTVGISAFASAQDDATDVCIRNFFEPATKYDPCDRDQSGRYHYVQNVDDATATICAAAYPDYNCEMASDTFNLVETMTDGNICTMNYDQPGVGNYCTSSPGLYQYGPGVSSEERE